MGTVTKGIFFRPLHPRTKRNCETTTPGQINWPGPSILRTKNNHGVKKTYNLCKRVEPIMQPMPHGSPGFPAVIVFSERELTFTFAICCRPSVVCLSPVTFVHRRLTQSVEIFGNVCTSFGTFAICWHPQKVLRRSSQGNPSVRGVKRKMGSQIERFRTYRTL